LLGDNLGWLGFFPLHYDLAQLDDDLLLEPVLFLVHVGWVRVGTLIGIQATCELSLLDLSKMSQFHVVPGISCWLVADFCLVLFLGQDKKIDLVLILIVVLLQVDRHSKLIVVDDICPCGIILVVHVGIEG